MLSIAYTWHVRGERIIDQPPHLVSHLFPYRRANPFSSCGKKTLFVVQVEQILVKVIGKHKLHYWNLLDQLLLLSLSS